uniref:Uncharacterized protein n=1 Tax=Tanacetum cinerariifolium TaxID=118510 RepID=A0A699GLH2_TANCI|nr:hypothetical protein [Tanacetum cinerariifolium]
MSDANKVHFKAEKEAIHMLLTGIMDEIYSTVDACNIAHEISFAPTSKQSSSTRSHATTRVKGKEIAKPITHPSESASKEDSDLEQAQRYKDMQKNLALIAMYFKKIYKPTNNNLRTTSNSRNKHVDTSPRYVKDNLSGQFGNQRTVTIVGAKETVSSQDTDEEVDEQELKAHYGFIAKIQEVLSADLGTDVEPLEKVQYDDEYNVFANEKQHYEQPDSINNTCAMEKVDRNIIPDSPNVYDNYDQANQNAKECDDERVVLANLIANLTLDTEKNKKILKQLKKSNASLSQELKECKSTFEETTRALGESNSTQDSCLISLQNQKVELEKYKTYLNRPIENDKLKLEHLEYVKYLENEIDKLESDKDDFSNIYDLLLQECVSKDVMCSYLHSLPDLTAQAKLQCLYVHKVKECECLAQKLSKQTKTISKEVYNELSRSFAKLEKHSISLELALQQCQEQMKNDIVCKQKASNVFLKEREQ